MQELTRLEAGMTIPFGGNRIAVVSPELAAAATVVVASRTGMPVSTTHILVGSVMGVGMARGIGSLDLRVIGNIIVSWLVTLPIGAGLSIVFFYILRAIFGG